MLHNRDGILVVICLVDFIFTTFMVVTIKFNFGLINPNDFVPVVSRLDYVLFGILYVGSFVALVQSPFFWQLNCAAQFYSSISLLWILK